MKLIRIIGLIFGIILMLWPLSYVYIIYFQQKDYGKVGMFAGPLLVIITVVFLVGLLLTIKIVRSDNRKTN